MSGHSKWSTIKHQKGAADAKRGKLFTKLAREIIVAARSGGPDPAMNSRLRLAVDRARHDNMPLDNIDRAIKRATGQGGEAQVDLEEVIYEGFGPAGTAILVIAFTDNRNRSASEVRHTFERNAGKMAQVGAVGYLFEQKGEITLELDPDRAEEVALLAIDRGAEDFSIDGSALEIVTTVESFESLRQWLEAEGLTLGSAEIAMVPKTSVVMEERPAEQALRLLERLEDLDDVQKVYSNADFPAEVLQKLGDAA